MKHENIQEAHGMPQNIVGIWHEDPQKLLAMYLSVLAPSLWHADHTTPFKKLKISVMYNKYSAAKKQWIAE